MSALPASSLTEHQGEIMYPDGVLNKFPLEESDKVMMEYMNPKKPSDHDDRIMEFYSSLISMRIILNGAHNALYGASKASLIGVGIISC